MSIRTGKRSLCAALVVGLMITGCGGGSDSTASLTKAQFVKQADAICRKVDKSQTAGLDKLTKEFSDPTKITKAVQKTWILEQGLPSVQQEAEEIAALGAPSGDEEQVAAIVKGIEEAVKKAEKDPLKSLESSFTGANNLAAKYGLKDCSEPL